MNERRRKRRLSSGVLAGGLFLATLVSLGVACLPVRGAVVIPRAEPAVQGNRGPSELVFSRDGRTVYVSESAENSIAVIDAETMAVVRRFPSGGLRPVGLALTPDESRLVVANTASGTVAVLDPKSGERRARVALWGMPWGVAIARDGARAFVTVSQLDEVAVLDLADGAVRARIPVGRRPRAVALTPDGKTLVVANLTGGSLSLIDPESLREEARVRLKGTNVRGVTVTPDGREVFATLMPAFNTKATSDPKEVWHNLVQSVILAGPESRAGEDQWMDFARVSGSTEVFGSPDQHGIEVDAAGEHAWVAVAGRDVVTRITIRDRRRNTVWPFSQVETVVGANPRGLAMRPGGRQLWVANHLGNSLSVIDTTRAQVIRTVDLGRASAVDPTIYGQYLFNNAGLTRLHRFTCASCHPDGGTDGLTWTFVHVQDGVIRRNSRDLRAGIAETAPFRWSGLEKHLEEFIPDEVTGLLRGDPPTRAETEALAHAVAGMALPPNPHRRPDGTMTELARRGETLFEGKAGCAACHSGPKRGGTGLKAWVGTTAEGRKLDVPHLLGAYDSAPYLHDGRAAALEEIFEKHNPTGRHGEAARLTPEERAAVLRYVREL